MPTQHVVGAGDNLAAIAAKHGYRNWRLVWEHAGNARLREARPDPDLLFPGDTVVVPDPHRRSLSAPVDRRHVYVVSGRRRVLRVRLLDANGQPLAPQRVRIVIDGGEPIDRTTDGDGVVEVPAPPGSRVATLHVGGLAREIDLAHLNPIDATADSGMSGLQMRLRNLGYLAEPPSGALDRATRIALALFQRDMGLPIDAEPGAATLDRLLHEHGC